MSHLANAIDQLMIEFKKTGAELARSTGLNAAQISRWKSADQTSIKPDCLKDLAAGFSPNARVHARLLYAHLQDECTGAGAQFITIKLAAAPTTTAAVAHKQVLPPQVQQDIDILTAAVGSDKRIRDIIHTLAALAGGKALAGS